MQSEPAGAFLLRKNRILRDGLLIAPPVFCADSVSGALMLCFVFGAVTLLTVMLSALIPRRLPFSVRIVSYSLAAALVYVPAALAAEYLFPASGAGQSLPLVASGLYLTVMQENAFEREHIRLTVLFARLICVILGVCAAVLLTGVLREMLGNGALLGRTLTENPPLPVLQTPAGGLLVTGGILIAAERICRSREAA